MYPSRQSVCLGSTNLLIAALIALPSLFMTLFATPYQRGFFCVDTTVRHPYKDSTISTPWLMVIGLGLPLVSVVAVEVGIGAGLDHRREASRRSWVSRFALMFQLYVGYLLGAAMSQSATDTCKYSIGRFRPHFIDVCRPDWSAIRCNDDEGNPLYIEDYTCLGNEELFPEEKERKSREKDAHLSFVSGHASWAFQGAVWAIMYLQARLVRDRTASSSFLLPFTQFAMFSLAFYTALSRVSDYKHNPGDVLMGALLGFAVQFVNVMYIQKLFRRASFRPPASDSSQDPEALIKRRPSTLRHFAPNE